MNQDLIRRAFESRVDTYAAAASLLVEHQNVAFNEPATMYLRTYLLPAQSVSETLDRAHLSESGVFQISIVIPPGEGAGQGEATAKALAALFSPQSPLPQDGALIWITDPPAISPGISEPSRYVIPLSISFRLDT
jgi:hypothetical protein